MWNLASWWCEMRVLILIKCSGSCMIYLLQALFNSSLDDEIRLLNTQRECGTSREAIYEGPWALSICETQHTKSLCLTLLNNCYHNFITFGFYVESRGIIGIIILGKRFERRFCLFKFVGWFWYHGELFVLPASPQHRLVLFSESVASSRIRSIISISLKFSSSAMTSGASSGDLRLFQHWKNNWMGWLPSQHRVRS